MRFCKFFLFVFVAFFTFSVYARYDDAEKAYLKSRGFTDKQIAESEAHLEELYNIKIDKKKIDAEAQKRYREKEAELGRKLTRRERLDIRRAVKKEQLNWEPTDLDKAISQAHFDRGDSLSSKIEKWFSDNSNTIERVAESLSKAGSH